jgi:NTP pyrophosphatase (non-canonical NTP hydrolase)
MNGYAAFVAELFAKRNDGIEGLLHAAVGLAGEAGELLDAIKKTWVYGKPLDAENVREEAGDALFFILALCHVQGWSLDDVIAANVAKLRKRYPQGYTDAAAAARADKVPA